MYVCKERQIETGKIQSEKRETMCMIKSSFAVD